MTTDCRHRQQPDTDTTSTERTVDGGPLAAQVHPGGNHSLTPRESSTYSTSVIYNKSNSNWFLSPWENNECLKTVSL